MRWLALALLGLVAAAAVAVIASRLVSQQIGLASEPISAGDALAPRVGAKPDHRAAPEPPPEPTRPPEPETTPEATAPAPEPSPAPEHTDDGVEQSDD